MRERKISAYLGGSQGAPFIGTIHEYFRDESPWWGLVRSDRSEGPTTQNVSGSFYLSRMSVSDWLRVLPSCIKEAMSLNGYVDNCITLVMLPLMVGICR